ncbi:MAG TPA: hypothetical protein VMH82_00820 [Myxococcota bacterium]|nr:hypothetical protein [Myxococcota bacterium]
MSAVKGTAIESVVADLNRLLQEGRISRDELEARLEAADLEVLDQKIVPALWYPIGTYGRFVELLFERDGGRRTEYLVERGRRAAERIRATGLYAQLSAERDSWGDRIGKILVSLGPAMFKDSAWSFEVLAAKPLRWRIEMRVPASFPDLCRHSTQGFIDYLTALHSGNTTVTSERSSPTLIVFRGEPAF